MSLWETVGSKLLLCAWQECEASIVCKEMMSPSMVGKKNPLTLAKFYETLKMQKEGIRSLPHLVDFNTPKFSAKHRYSLVECLILNVNKQVFGGGCPQESLFSVSKSLHKLDKPLFLQESVRYIELMMHQKSKDSYEQVIREQFADSVIFGKSQYFKGNTDECVWDEIEPELLSPSLRGSEMSSPAFSSPETLSVALGVAGVEKRKRGAVSELSTEGKGIMHVYRNVFL